LNVTPPSRRQIVSRRFITYLDAGGDAGVTMIRFLQEARLRSVFFSLIAKRRVVVRKFPDMKQPGFTLVELMIVVAIIGVLVAMAIPDYLNFTTKVKQAEAKVNLGGIFVAETGYFAEMGAYANNFDQLGWSPQTVNKYAYDLGNGNICYPETKIDRCWTTPTPIVTPQNNAPPGVTAKQFTAVAYANLDSDVATDTWQINDARELTCTNDDSSATQ